MPCIHAPDVTSPSPPPPSLRRGRPRRHRSVAALRRRRHGARPAFGRCGTACGSPPAAHDDRSEARPHYEPRVGHQLRRRRPLGLPAATTATVASLVSQLKTVQATNDEVARRQAFVDTALASAQAQSAAVQAVSSSTERRAESLRRDELPGPTTGPSDDIECHPAHVPDRLLRTTPAKITCFISYDLRCAATCIGEVYLR